MFRQRMKTWENGWSEAQKTYMHKKRDLMKNVGKNVPWKCVFPACAAEAGMLLRGNATNNWSEGANKTIRFARLRNMDFVTVLVVFFSMLRRQYQNAAASLDTNTARNFPAASPTSKCKNLFTHRDCKNRIAGVTKTSGAADARDNMHTYEVAGKSSRSTKYTVKVWKDDQTGKQRADCGCGLAKTCNKSGFCIHIGSVIFTRQEKMEDYVDKLDTIGAAKSVHHKWNPDIPEVPTLCVDAALATGQPNPLIHTSITVENRKGRPKLNKRMEGYMDRIKQQTKKRKNRQPQRTRTNPTASPPTRVSTLMNAPRGKSVRSKRQRAHEHAGAAGNFKRAKQGDIPFQMSESDTDDSIILPEPLSRRQSASCAPPPPMMVCELCDELKPTGRESACCKLAACNECLAAWILGKKDPTCPHCRQSIKVDVAVPVCIDSASDSGPTAVSIHSSSNSSDSATEDAPVVSIMLR